ncbi:zinc/manganese transport system ATP-binding protein [Salinibacterium sp. CAN_S4]
MLRVENAAMRFGERSLWGSLNLDIEPGEFVAVLGANGSGKTTLLKAILGQQPLSQGSIEFLGAPVRRGNRRIGYVPQQKLADPGTPLRARDLVAQGIDGHRWGIPLPSRSRRRKLDELLADIGASSYANVPLSILSGGEQQRLRVGQALAGDPRLLLCDEPLLSLDLAHQRSISELINHQRNARGFGVVFVTHDINPILTMVDRVLYLAGGRFRIGTPDEVLQSSVLSELYGADVDVIRANGRVIVVGATDTTHPHPAEEQLR